MSKLPEGAWISKDKEPSKPFKALMNRLAKKEVKAVAVADESLTAELDQKLEAANVLSDRLADLANIRDYNSGAKSGSTVTVEPDLETTEVFWTINKTGLFVIQSIEVIDKATVKITSNASTTYSNIRIWTLE